MIHINNLHKRFGDSHVLRGISCDIKPQEVVCIIGPSGSGKSTFLRCMNAPETVSEGEVVVNGFAAHDRTTDLNKMRESVGMVFQRFNLFPHMTVRKPDHGADESAQYAAPAGYRLPKPCWRRWA